MEQDRLVALFYHPAKVRNPAKITAGMLTGRRTLALDWGKARIGLAITDESGVYVQALPTLHRKNRATDLGALSRIIEDNGISTLVVGAPLHLDGAVSASSSQAEQLGRTLAKRCGIELVLWDELLDAGAEFDILPCGLGCRNTLRLEAAMALHGHEISEDITPLEAGLGWIVKLNKGDFVGRDALLKQKQDGVPRKLIGFEMRGRGIARDGYPVMKGNEQIGFVTSGSPAPFLEKNIGMALLQIDAAKSGGAIDIQVRTRGVEAEIVPLPFYSRKKD